MASPGKLTEDHVPENTSTLGERSTIVAMACSSSSEERVRWTLRLQEDTMKMVLETPVDQEYAQGTGESRPRPHGCVSWCLPSEAEGEYVAVLEDVLDLYEMPYNPARPVVCMNEKSWPLLGEKGRAGELDPGRVGACSVFAFVEPLGGRHRFCVGERSTATDWARQIKELVDVMYPEAEKVILVMNNRNIHAPSSLYKAFPPQEASRIWEKLELHYLPKGGGWLNLAEMELYAMMHQQGLEGRKATREEVRRALAAWEEERNHRGGKVKWLFKILDARTKLASLYPNVG